jgi:hypothetical protein
MLILIALLQTGLDIKSKGGVLLITPFVVYSTAEDRKKLVLEENKGKSGVYRWVNLITGDSYIGSASDLSVRLKRYYSTNQVRWISSFTIKKKWKI